MSAPDCGRYLPAGLFTSSAIGAGSAPTPPSVSSRLRVLPSAWPSSRPIGALPAISKPRSSATFSASPKTISGSSSLIALIVFAVLIMIRRQLLFATFDPEVASAYGVSTGKIDLIFVTLLAITVLASTQILGVTLVAAAMVIPPVIARYLTNRFQTPADSFSPHRCRFAAPPACI